MCKAPKPPTPTAPDKPEYLRNPYLDAAIGRAGDVNAIRKGRSSLRIPLGSGLAINPLATSVLPPATSVLPPATATPLAQLPGGTTRMISQFERQPIRQLR